MLFDLRGRGRRRTVQVIYVTLALLMGGGLVLFGIGGNTSGGLVDAINGGGGSSTSADKVFEKRLKTYEQRARANPGNAANWSNLARLHFQQAGTGENFNSSVGAYTAKGLGELRDASAAWKRHLAVAGDKPDPNAASLMAQAYGQAGLKQYPDAVKALEIFIDARKATPQLYGQLAILAAAAKQDRKSRLAEDKAVALTPKKDRKTFKGQIDLAKQQLTATPSSTPATSTTAERAAPGGRSSLPFAAARPCSSTGRAADS